MYHLLWIFFIYAFLGWCTEVSYAALKTGRFVNRGFLNGPVCPVYGFGVVIVLWVLEPLRGNLLLLFLGSVALTSLLEWLTGFVLERLFHQRWWDYSQEPFNLGGYICLRFSIAWGLACLFVVKLLHPLSCGASERSLIPWEWGCWLSFPRSWRWIWPPRCAPLPV
ncbi:MAG: putative ABC transporter permease [Oscillospiraceae bacterium]